MPPVDKPTGSTRLARHNNQPQARAKPVDAAELAAGGRRTESEREVRRSAYPPSSLRRFTSAWLYFNAA